LLNPDQNVTLTHANRSDGFEISNAATRLLIVNKAQIDTMAEDFVLNSVLSVFLDDYHEMSSDFDASGLSPKEIEIHVNRRNPFSEKLG
jgi:hypothetical protein